MVDYFIIVKDADYSTEIKSFLHTVSSDRKREVNSITLCADNNSVCDLTSGEKYKLFIKAIKEIKHTYCFAGIILLCSRRFYDIPEYDKSLKCAVLNLLKKIAADTAGIELPCAVYETEDSGISRLINELSHEIYWITSFKSSGGISGTALYNAYDDSKINCNQSEFYEVDFKNSVKDVYEKYLSGKSIVLQTVGDSITWGLNHCTPEQTYTAELCKLFAENTSADIVRYDSIAPRNTGRIKGFERIEVRNNGADRKISIIRNGVGGDSVLRALKRYEDFTGEITEGLRPDIITLLFGVNDALENDPMKFVSENIFKTNLQLLIKTIYTFNPEAAVVLLTPSYNDDGTTDKSCLDKYAKKVKEVGVEFNIPVIDIHKKWMEHLITGSENNGQREWLSNVKWDMTHLSPIGSRAMAEHIFDGLKNLIK